MEFDLTHSILSSIAPQGLRRTFELVGTKMIRLDAARLRAAPDQQQQNKSKGACRSVALPRAFACEERGASFSMAVLGDLHLPPEDAVPEDFLKARDQLRRDMVASAPGAAHRVVQLGDLGAYDKGFPGSAACFRMAKSFIDSFEIPARLILGNHDLEDAALDSDAENLAAWREAFGQSHYWSSKIGNVTFVGLSTVRFRSNEHSVHEVHIDDEQIAFFERVLGDAGRDGSPVVVFTHAPILGSGLKAVQAVHVKNRCAWVNHSSNADHFISLVRRNPNVKLWFSGHFHLSQSYPDSISVVGGTAFVLTGVIGGSMSRDGDRHSRVLRGDESGFEVLTMDHETGESRVDLKGSWDARDTPRILTPPEELICDISSGFLCSEVDCSVGGSIDEGDEDDQRTVWFNSGATSMLHLQDGLLIEVRDESLVHAPVLALLLLLLLLSHILVALALTLTLALALANDCSTTRSTWLPSVPCFWTCRTSASCGSSTSGARRWTRRRPTGPRPSPSRWSTRGLERSCRPSHGTSREDSTASSSRTSTC